MGEHLIKESSVARVFNPQALLLSIIDELQSLIDKQKIKIDYEMEGVDKEVMGFAEIVRLIVMDLLVVLMSEEQGREIDILLAREYCEPGTLVFMAEDSRRVIASDKIEEILFGEKQPNLIRAETLLKQVGGVLQIKSTEEFGTTLVMVMPVQVLQEEGAECLLNGKYKDKDFDWSRLVPKIFKPKELLFSIADEFKIQIESKNIRLDYTIEAGYKQVITYPDILRQIIRELLMMLIGSISYGEIKILLENNLNSQGTVLVMIESKDWSLSDDALPDFLARDKEHLERVEYLVEQLHGTFEVDSDLDVGGAFIVTIPAIYPLLSECTDE